MFFVVLAVLGFNVKVFILEYGVRIEGCWL